MAIEFLFIAIILSGTIMGKEVDWERLNFRIEAFNKDREANYNKMREELLKSDPIFGKGKSDNIKENLHTSALYFYLNNQVFFFLNTRSVHLY